MYAAAVVRRFDNADSAMSALSPPTTGATPNLMVVDLAIPAGRPALSQLPGVDVVTHARVTTPGLRIIVRTGLQDDVIPPGLVDAGTQVTKKGDPPEAFLHLVSSFLALEGFQAAQLPVFVTPSLPVAGGSAWFSAGMVLAAIPAATSLWVASMLQVTSCHGPVFAAWMIVLGICGGIMLSGSKVVGFRSKLGSVLACAGTIVVLMAGLALPPIV
jgi:hypothetical protein